jgi:iron complex transport system substrate-binding protein
MGKRSASLIPGIALAFALAACGSNDAGPGGGVTGAATSSGSSTATGVTSTTGPAFPVTVTGTTGAVTIDAEPQRIVSLSPSATEDLFAVGAGDQVVAVDDQSDYPDGVPTTNLSGYEPNVEAIAGYDPDLVVYATEPGDLGDSLEALGIQALQLDAPTDLDGAFAQLQTLATATGHASEGATFVSDLRSRVSDVTADADTTSGLTYYYELDDTYYSVTSDTFIGQLFETLGMENVADAAKGASSGYPQLSAEYIVEQDPDLIFLADTECCGQSAQTVADRPGWTDLSAVTNGNVVELQDDVASRWGPRVVDLLEQISDAATSASEAAAA